MGMGFRDAAVGGMAGRGSWAGVTFLGFISEKETLKRLRGSWSSSF